jgi:hypothetical protein
MISVAVILATRPVPSVRVRLDWTGPHVDNPALAPFVEAIERSLRVVLSANGGDPDRAFPFIRGVVARYNDELKSKGGRFYVVDEREATPSTS